MLQALSRYADWDIQLFIPLSYGEEDEEYKCEVAATAKDIFGTKAFILREFMPREKYLDFLEDIDIAVFANQFDHGMGNIRNLLAMGKKVYTSRGLVLRKEFASWGVTLYDFETVSETLMDEMPEELRLRNMRILAEKCSKAALIESWRSVFEYSIQPDAV